MSVSSSSTQGKNKNTVSYKEDVMLCRSLISLHWKKKHTDFHYGASSVVTMRPASVFVGSCCRVCWDGFLHVLLLWRVPSWCLFWLDVLTKDRLMMDVSFLTFNMEVSFLIDWANQDFLLLLIILSMWYYYKPLSFTHRVCNPAASLNTNECETLMRARRTQSLTSTMKLFMLPLLCW